MILSETKQNCFRAGISMKQVRLVLLFLLLFTCYTHAAKVLVSTFNGNQILQYDVNNGIWIYEKVFASGIYDGGALTYPMGMCKSSDGLVYVGEQVDGGRVLRFNAVGEYVDTLITDGDAFFDARCEAVIYGPDQKIYVVDAFAGADCVYRIDPDTGDCTTFIPTEVSGQYALDNPRSIAFNPDNGHCFVVSRQNDSVFEFDANGIYVKTVDNGIHVDYPQDCMWFNGQLFVLSTSGTAAVDRFNSNGTFDQRILNTGVLPESGISMGAVNEQLYVIGWSSNAVYKILDVNTVMPVTPLSGAGFVDKPNRMMVLDETNVDLSSMASNPLPANGRAYIDPADVTVYWSLPEETVEPISHYKIYFGTDETVVLEAEDDDVCYQGSVPADSSLKFDKGQLAYNQTYYWRVDTVLSNTTVIAGTVWNFTTEYIDIPGAVVDYSPNSATVYVGCPSIAIMPDGSYRASHSWFGGGTSNNQTVVFSSYDDGKTWKTLAQITGQWWSTLFYHNGALYLMGVDGVYGKCVIRESTDGGVTWTTPTDSSNGLLFADSPYHCAPVPVQIHNGRIWRAMEDAHDPGGWGDHFRAFMMSAPVDANLLNAANWTASNRLSHDKDNWTGTGWLEGNAVLDRQGNMLDILRVDAPETAAIVRISADGTTATFDSDNDFIHFYGGASKFTIRYDEVSDRYWSLVSKQADPVAARNRLALVSSVDLRNWQVEEMVLEHPDTAYHAWQYIDWLVEGNDIVFVSRTAYDDGLGGQAHNYHDANFFTFHRIQNFRGPRKPVFYIQPESETVSAGQTVILTCGANTDINSYQWFKKEVDGDLELFDGDANGRISIVSDEAGTTLTIAIVDDDAIGEYYCVATNMIDSTVSEIATLRWYRRTMAAHWRLDETEVFDLGDDVYGPVFEEMGNYPDAEIWSYEVGMLDHPGAAGGVDRAYDFTVDSGIIGVSTNTTNVIPETGDFSLVISFKTDQYHNSQGHLFSNNNGQVGRANLYVNNGLVAWWAHNGPHITASARIDDNQWHNVIVTRRGDLWNLYLDGSLAGLQTISCSFDQYTTWMIGRGRSYNFNYEGLVGDVRIYNYAVDEFPDLNGDGNVNMGDFAIFASEWGHFDCGACTGADLNLDDVVDTWDLADFLDHWLSQ